MKVVCTKLPATVSAGPQDRSPWVTVHAEYRVVSLIARPAGRVQIQIVTDDGRSLAWFDSTDFMTVDHTVPATWVAKIGEGGTLELAPTSWLAPGFWESYYEGDRAAADAVEAELSDFLGGGPT
jgi:hypothetical protein